MHRVTPGARRARQPSPLRPRLACWLWLAIVGPLQAAAPPSPLPALPPALRGEVEAILRSGPVQGAAIVLVDADGPTGAHWHGMADAAAGRPLTADTCMPVGGVSQTFTALLAHRLADQGKLALDAALPADLQPPPPAAGGRCAAQVTLAQLLEHTAGVVDPERPGGLAAAGDGRSPPAAAGAVQRPLAWCPGLHHRPSDSGIVLAAAALERAGGSDFGTLMQREIFLPLGIPDASFGDRPACRSRGGDADGPARTPNPATALLATPVELARTVQMFLRYGAGSGGSVVEACGVAHMAVGTSGLAGRQGAAGGAPGRGLQRLVAADRTMVGQTGRIDGFRTVIGFLPEAGKGLVVMLDTDDGTTLQRLVDAVAAHLWQGVPPAPLPAVERPAGAIAGWYQRVSPASASARWSAGFDVVRIAQDDGGLAVRGLWPWSPARRVLAVAPTAFRDERLPVASMAFVPASPASGDVRWWIDGESFREVAPWRVAGRLAALVLTVGVIAVVSVGGVFAVVNRWRPSARPPGAARPARALPAAPSAGAWLPRHRGAER